MRQSAVVEIGFHPRAQVLFSATSDRRLRLFQIDGTTNPLLQTLHVPELPIQAAAFHPSGSSVLLTGSRPFFLSYDLQTGQTLRSPRGLLNAGLGGSDRASTGGSGGLERFRFSPGTGDVLALAGRRGYVHLVDWGASGVSRGGQVLGEVKMNAPVVGLAWQRDGRELVTLGEDSDVYVWDVGTRKCVERWRDEGGFGARAIETSRDGKWTAVGSSTGIVNLYDDASAGQAGLGSRRLEGQERKARKAVENLVTPVSTMRFNHDAQLVALASKTNKDQLKLVRRRFALPVPLSLCRSGFADAGCPRRSTSRRAPCSRIGRRSRRRCTTSRASTFQRAASGSPSATSAERSSCTRSSSLRAGARGAR